MTSTYTTNLGLEQPGSGDYAAGWATVANTQYSLLDQAITGIVSVDVTGSSNITLTDTNGASNQARNAIIYTKGIPTAQIRIIVPSSKTHLYAVRAKHTGPNWVELGTGAGVAVTVAPLENFAFISNGLHCRKLGTVAKKTIMYYYGPTAPPGWAVCNGLLGTPDLTTSGLFVKAGTSLGNNAGGVGSIVATSTANHNHTGNTGATTLTLSQIPSHAHNYNINAGLQPVQSGVGSTSNSAVVVSATASVGGDGSHLHTISNDGAHTHTITVSGNFEPASYTLLPIMKVT